jgi:thiamine-monophosphate kinase
LGSIQYSMNVDEDPMSTHQGLGERRIIEVIVDLQDKMRNNPLPFGDDVSAVRIGGGRLAVLKCDMLVGLTDVPEGMSLRQAARKAVVSSVSDFAAKGVQPLALLASLGLPRRFGDEDVKEIGLGLNSGAREHNTYILGGDTNESTDLTVDVSAFGVCREKELVRRDSAKVGDVVAVTGNFGLTALGLRMTIDHLEVPQKLKEATAHSIYMPKARLIEGLALAGNHLVSASIDSSDGLAWSLYELARSSRVGFEIENLPIDRKVEDFALRNNLSPSDLALYGGEEYELVVTIKPKNLKKAKSIVSRLKPIGRVTAEHGKIILKSSGETHEIEPRGYEHLVYGGSS